ncbi:riboflavin synthase [Halanaerobacter jeridensis]|uniref:Riboflavin synthase n=1 Tax=Halanaerobacter jeridensis TaxID=706427 RepID=A0A938XQK5_9FIRM|nr:riboflavin synthase [Halanaerobacter jeridensis]MBM7555520.1 riboflavin synthase [Halanaerobacter jeridensis]
MFTGIVEELGEVKNIKRSSQSIILTIKAEKVLEDIKIGDSIATNGVCLTVTDFSENEFEVDVTPETMRKSSLGELSIRDKVNLERALRLKDRLGGHLVSGHIDGTGKIAEKKREDNAILITIRPEPKLLKYIIAEGSIAIDGISLTVAKLTQDSFTVSIIPHTNEVTTLSSKKVGNIVNLETDMIGKYVERMMEFEEEQENTDIDMKKLRDNGFLLA